VSLSNRSAHRCVSLSASISWALTQGYLASAYALKGEMGRAASALAEVRRLSGDGFYSRIARVKAARYFGVPKVSALYEATYIAGLRKAGIPEE
jgi:hypothetical protein